MDFNERGRRKTHQAHRHAPFFNPLHPLFCIILFYFIIKTPRWVFFTLVVAAYHRRILVGRIANLSKIWSNHKGNLAGNFPLTRSVGQGVFLSGAISQKHHGDIINLHDEPTPFARGDPRVIYEPESRAQHAFRTFMHVYKA